MFGSIFCSSYNVQCLVQYSVVLIIFSVWFNVQYFVVLRAPDKLRICVFYAMKTSKNACIIRSECTHYAYILLCKQTFQIRSVLAQSFI